MSPKRPFYLSLPKITVLIRVAPEPFANKSHIRILEIADNRIPTPSSLIGLQTLFQLTKRYLKSASPPFHKKSLSILSNFFLMPIQIWRSDIKWVRMLAKSTTYEGYPHAFR